MAKALSNLLFKGLAGLPATRTSRIVPGCYYQSGMRYATTVPNEPDIYEDFNSTNKLESSDRSLRDVEQIRKRGKILTDLPGSAKTSSDISWRAIVEQSGELKEKLKDIAHNQKTE